ncbi:response regulator [Pleionea sp. CnH1-48]|uniref:response regulator n=1 Tax=Pleionea sp. CnH1-48 TaxID=2954494 RepID=UPI002097D1B8|nr:response regulator [Pleionea sp. CnH1-48]MCO7223019.1 response regulator [Pleionea sp. CnH1-48]
MNLSCILIVDDNEGDQYICQHTIQKECPDTVILQAFDGVEALEVLESSELKPDLIILDINMPRMNGHEFLEAYAKKPENEKSSVVIMLTSSVQESDREQAMAHQCVIDFFNKPLDAEDIDKLKKR